MIQTCMHGLDAAGEKAHISRIASRDVQPDQLSHASGSDIDDPPRSLGVEHDAPGHLRLDGHGAVDAERRRALSEPNMFVLEHMLSANS